MFPGRCFEDSIDDIYLLFPEIQLFYLFQGCYNSPEGCQRKILHHYLAYPSWQGVPSHCAVEYVRLLYVIMGQFKHVPLANIAKMHELYPTMIVCEMFTYSGFPLVYKYNRHI